MKLDAAVLRAPKTLLGTIVATTTKNNHDTAAAFNNTTGNTLAGKLLFVQCDTACHINWGVANTITATAANGYHLPAYGEKYLLMDEGSSGAAGYGFLACLADSGTTNLKVWEVSQR